MLAQQEAMRLPTERAFDFSPCEALPDVSPDMVSDERVEFGPQLREDLLDLQLRPPRAQSVRTRLRYAQRGAANR